MLGFHRFLLVDDVAENRFLLSKALLKAFPNAVVLECQDSSTAVSIILHENCSVVIVHRARDLDGKTFIDLVRRCSRPAPVILVSEDNAMPDEVTSGADKVVSWNAWQKIGPICAELIAKGRPRHRYSTPNTDLA